VQLRRGQRLFDGVDAIQTGGQILVGQRPHRRLGDIRRQGPDLVHLLPHPPILEQVYDIT
jgi:hypothetical protein